MRQRSSCICSVLGLAQTRTASVSSSRLALTKYRCCASVPLATSIHVLRSRNLLQDPSGRLREQYQGLAAGFMAEDPCERIAVLTEALSMFAAEALASVGGSQSPNRSGSDATLPSTATNDSPQSGACDTKL